MNMGIIRKLLVDFLGIKDNGAGMKTCALPREVHAVRHQIRASQGLNQGGQPYSSTISSFRDLEKLGGSQQAAP
jgi:hypothetical protein